MLGSKTGGRLLIAAAVAAAAAGLGSGTVAHAAVRPDPALASLPQVASGHRPGPDLLYAPPPENVQVQSHDPAFRAPFTFVSASERYTAGEWQYEDTLNDDRGPDLDGGGDAGTGPAQGDLVYPTDVARYANNASDLVEVRVTKTRHDALVRFTFLTMRRADDAIASLVLDTDSSTSTGAAVLPRDPGAVTFPGADLVVTTWGTGAEVSALTAGPTVTTPVTARADVAAAQLTVRIPRRVADPHGTARWVAVSGLRDPATGGWLRPANAPTATVPGSGTDTPASGIFDLAPQPDEPCYREEVPCDTLQSQRLGAGTPMASAGVLDFGALDARTSRDLVPRTGRLFRIFPSRLHLGGGRTPDFPQFKADLQEYATFVPSKVLTGERIGLTWYFHSNDRYHWGFSPSPFLQWLGEDRGTIVVTPLSRHQGEFYRDEAEADIWEVWNDLARHYRLDPADTVAFGTSMGGYGAYRVTTLHPDLFARAATNIGPPGAYIWAPPKLPELGYVGLTNLWLDNVRNVPFFNMVASTDELVPYTGTKAQNLGSPEHGIRGFDQLGYRFRFRTYQPAEHIVLSLAYEPDVKTFLDGARVDLDPFHVTLRYLPFADHPALGIVRDHAYWVSDVRMRSDAPRVEVGPEVSAQAEPPQSALVDVVSHARGVADPVSFRTTDAGVLTEHTLTGPLAWDEVGREWDAPAAVPARNALTATLTGVAHVALDPVRAGLDPCAPLHLDLTSDGPSTLFLPGVDAATVTGAAARAADGGAEVDVPAGATAVESDGCTTVTPAVPELPATAVVVLVFGGVTVVTSRRRFRVGSR
jgi:hypothetical protein